MLKDLQWYQTKARKMVANDVERDKLHEGMERMHHLDWDIPAKLKNNADWVRRFISTEPFDALRTGTRVMSTVIPKITMLPTVDNQANKDVANRIERSLKWQLMGANRRGKAKVVSDVVLSALRHDEVCLQVVDLEVQESSVSAIGGDSTVYKAAKRYGRFALLVRNPRQVHFEFDDWMLRRVVYVNTISAQEAKDFWGDMLKMTQDEIDNTPLLTIYDYEDLEARAIWAFPASGENMADGGSPFVIMEPATNEKGFIPWVCKVGGTNLDAKPENQRYPLLYGPYVAGQWVSKNIIESLVNSEVIAHAFSPRGAVTGPEPSKIQVDAGDPARMVELKPGETYQQLMPNPMDKAMQEIADRLGQSIEKGTISSILSGNMQASGMAFGTINMLTGAAVKSIAPHVTLAQDALAEALTIMLLFVDYTKEPMMSFGNGKEDYGQQLTVTNEDFSTSAIYISVELTADVPTDRMGRVNAGAILVERLGGSKERGLEEAGIEDPKAEMRNAFYEQLLTHELQLVMQRKDAQLQLEIQAMQMQMQMQAQQMAAQAQQQAAQSQQNQSQFGGAPNPEQTLGNEMATGGMPGAEGQGFNPAMGGTPPSQMNPNTTRESQTGMTQSGAPVME